MSEIIKTDVAVIGGGPGGLSAAIAAARQGVKVLLVERNGFVGGNLATGLPLLSFLDSHGRQVIGGFAQELVDRLTAMGGSYGHRVCPFHDSVTVVNPMYSRIIMFEILKECGVELLLHCEASGVVLDNGKLTAVKVTGKGQEFEIRADVFVDGTGDGDIAYMAGAEYKKGQDATGVLQPSTLMFDIGGINFNKFFDYIEAHPEELPYKLNLPHIRTGYDSDYFRSSPNYVFFGLNSLISRLREEGKCPIARDTAIFIRQPVADHVTVNTVRILNFDGSDIRDLSRGESEGHLQILPIVEMFRENVPGFEECYLASISPFIGVRESRRIVGEKTLTSEEAVNCIIPDDSIALGSYMIDIHSGDGKDTFIQTLDGPYGIPYGCTLVKSIDGLMLTGRCISVDAVTFGSSRVMPICMAVGEGVGIGASLAVKQKISPKSVSPDDIRSILKENKAILSI